METKLNSLNEIENLDISSIQDSKLNQIYTDLLDLSEKDDIQKRIDLNSGYTSEIINQWNSRVELLELNETYNNNFQKFIDDHIEKTEKQIQKYDYRRKVQYTLTPSRFDKLKNLSDEKFHEWMQGYIIRGIRANLTFETLKSQLISKITLEKYEEISSIFEETYLKKSNEIDDRKDSNLSELSLNYKNSFHINFEKLFGRSSNSCRAIYQTLTHIADMNGKSLIQFESYKTLAIKSRTKIKHTTVKDNLIRLAEVGLIGLKIKNKEENEALRVELANLVAKKKIKIDEYTKRLKEEIKPEFLEEIITYDNSSFVTLEKKVETKFFKSELLNIKGLGKRGNEIFWIIYDNGRMTKKELYSYYPTLENKTDSIREKVNLLIELEFVNLIKKEIKDPKTNRKKTITEYEANTHDIILKIEKAKELDNLKAKNRTKNYNEYFEKVKKERIERFGLMDDRVEKQFSNENISKTIYNYKKLLQTIGKNWKNGLTIEQIKAKFKTLDINVISQLSSLAILIYDKDLKSYKLNKELYDLHTKKRSSNVRIPHQGDFSFFLEKQTEKYERDRARRLAYKNKEDIREELKVLRGKVV
ncbi:hypothetical protein EHR02_00065 [Leptospira levettii]|uniref:hypothetical protein n=1 Tax=Leptospira levettii TaxID=2023178 RepID=UPI001083CD0D|nr:hypothetical protein [Leptospira levettii]TGM95032.1 hypothetical protein EHR02_00065 [Leptospira levettii]